MGFLGRFGERLDVWAGFLVESGGRYGSADLIRGGIPRSFLKEWGDHVTWLDGGVVLMFKEDGEYLMFRSEEEMLEKFAPFGGF